jgi:TldD protein
MTTDSLGSTRHLLDPAFTALPLRQLADAALSAAAAAGASYADFRFERSMTADLTIRDTAVQSATNAVSTGYAVRVIVDGTWGFAASVVPTADEAAGTGRQAAAVARALAGVVAQRVERADEPVYHDQTWVSSYHIDPFAVATGDKIALLLDRSERLLASDGVAHTTAGLYQVKENKFYADSAGTVTTQQRVRLQPSLTATAVDTSSGAFETMSSLTPPVGRGYEYLTDGTWDFESEIAAMGEQLTEKIKAPSIAAGRYDLVIDPTNRG